MKRYSILLLPVCIYSWLIVVINYSYTREPEQIQATETQTISVAPALQLGQKNAKWRADKFTTSGIENMQQIMEVFAAGNNVGSLEAYQELGITLNGEMKTLFRQCTMTGPAHDKLHTFLTPIMQDVKILQGNNLEASITAQLRLEEQLSGYHTFFE